MVSATEMVNTSKVEEPGCPWAKFGGLLSRGRQTGSIMYKDEVHRLDPGGRKTVHDRIREEMDAQERKGPAVGFVGGINKKKIRNR